MPTRTMTVLGRVIERGPWSTFDGLGVAELRDVWTDTRCLLLRWDDAKMSEPSHRYARIPAPTERTLVPTLIENQLVPREAEQRLMLYVGAIVTPSIWLGERPTIDPRHALGTPWAARSEEDAIRDMIRSDHALGEVGR